MLFFKTQYMANFTPLGGLKLPEIENWLSAEITQTMGSIWPPANKKNISQPCNIKS